MNEKEFLVGIDYGTSNSCVGVFINGQVRIIPNKLGEEITPSVVLYENDKELPLVGEEAFNESITNNTNYITEVKRFIGLTYEQFIESKFDKSVNCEIVEIKNMPNIKIDLNGKPIYKTAEEISSLIIKKMMHITETFLIDYNKGKGTKIGEAFFTIPAHFFNHQEIALVNAAKSAGIKIPRIINEPTAAALAYFGRHLISNNNDKKNVNNLIDEYKLDPRKKIMVFDLGGGTFDISILNLKVDKNNIDFEPKITDGDTHLGGSDFDEKLKDKCINEFCEENNINKQELLKDKNAMRRLKAKCENTKKLLGIKNVVFINLQNFYNNIDLFVKTSREEFLEITSELILKIKKKIIDVFKEEKLTKDDFQYVILIGGGSKIWGIKQILIDIFGKDKIKDDIDPEKAVAIGATLNAAKIKGEHNINFNLQDITSFNIGIGVKNQKIEERNFGDVMHTIIPKYSKFPGKKYEKKYEVTLSERHPEIIVNVYEGNNKFVRQNTRIGRFHVSDIGKKGVYQYIIEFQVDSDGKLSGKLKCDKLNIIKDYESINGISNALIGGKSIKISRNNNIKPISNLIEFIEKKENEILNCKDFNTRLRLIEECCPLIEDLIKNYSYFLVSNENIYEKLFKYTTVLYKNYYLQLINAYESKKDKIHEIINKIKEKMKNFIKEPDYMEELLKIFLEIKNKFINEYYQIIVNYIELLNNKGIDLLDSKYSRYYSKLYFQNVFYCKKKYVIYNELALIDPKIRENYEKQIKKNYDGLIRVNSYAPYIDKCIKNEQFIAGKTGYTSIDEKVKKLEKNPSKEEALDILDIFHNMLDSFDKNEESIEVAFCLAHIILINYSILNIKDYDKLEVYIKRFKFIMKTKNLEKIPKYQDTIDIINEIDNANKENI